MEEDMDKDGPGDPAKEPIGFAVLAALLPELLRRAKDVDCVCENCKNKHKGRPSCLKLGPMSPYMPDDGPPWRECRWFSPTEEHMKKTADNPTFVDLFTHARRDDNK